jgi:hypothetical protein
VIIGTYNFGINFVAYFAESIANDLKGASLVMTFKAFDVFKE